MNNLKFIVEDLIREKGISRLKLIRLPEKEAKYGISQNDGRFAKIP